jgi:hypothetical protein
VGKDDANEAFHVAGAAPEETAVADLWRERVAVPVLTVDRHDVGVSGQGNPTIAATVAGGGS